MEFFVNVRCVVPEGRLFCRLLYFFLLTNFVFWDISLVEWKISSLRNRCQSSCHLQMDPTIKRGIEGIGQIVDGAIRVLFAQFLIQSAGSWGSHFVWSIIKKKHQGPSLLSFPFHLTFLIQINQWNLSFSFNQSHQSKWQSEPLHGQRFTCPPS